VGKATDVAASLALECAAAALVLVQLRAKLLSLLLPRGCEARELTLARRQFHTRFISLWDGNITHELNAQVDCETHLPPVLEQLDFVAAAHVLHGGLDVRLALALPLQNENKNKQ
jgi:hypothetical protein